MRWAEPSEIESAVQDWTEAQLHCRTYGHTWRPLNVTHRPGEYTVTQRCSRCRNKRSQRLDDLGYPRSPWVHEYRDGYLLDQVGRIGYDGRATLRLAVLHTLDVTEEVDDA